MIISASRRTDIPAWYGNWLMNRLTEGYVLVPNPRFTGRLSRVDLSPEVVDCIVFWTKNPIPFLPWLDSIRDAGYRFYFEYTITPYDLQIERNLPDKRLLIDAFRNLSARIGKQRVDWRYDPILLTERYTVAYHLQAFEAMCHELSAYTERCIISFVDCYAHLGGKVNAVSDEDIDTLARHFSVIAAAHGLPLFTCAESCDLERYGIRHGSCIDQAKIEQIIGCPIRVGKDKGQRPACGCIESIDIGTYDTCRNGCIYCYATTSDQAVVKQISAHDDHAPMLTGCPAEHQQITNRIIRSVTIH